MERLINFTCDKMDLLVVKIIINAHSPFIAALKLIISSNGPTLGVANKMTSIGYLSLYTMLLLIF